MATTPSILVFLGSPAAGKSTLAFETFRSGVLGTTAWIYNDEGTDDIDPGSVFDAAILADVTDVHAMTSGCFGCKDEASLLEEISKISKAGSYSWIVLEPFGFASGDEIPAVLRRNGYGFEVITLFDVENRIVNQRLGTIPSHLAQATIGICLTRYPENPEHPDLEEAMTYIYEHAPAGTPSMKIAKGDRIPDIFISALRARRNVQPIPTSCIHHHHHPHVHQEGCGHHTHDRYNHAHADDPSYGFPLIDETTVGEVRAAFDRAPKDVYRIKGFAGGYEFQALHGTWAEPVPCARHAKNQVIFYAHGPVSTEFLNGLVKNEQRRIARSTKELLRSTENCSTADSIELLRHWMARCPTRTAYNRSGPVVYTEATEIVNDLRKRPDVITVAPHVANEAISMRVDHAIRIVQENPHGSEWYENPCATEWKRDCAITIAWFALHRPDTLGEKRMKQIENLDLNDLLAKGLRGLERFNSDPEKARTFAEEAGDVIRFTKALPNDLADEFRRCLQLAQQWDLSHGTNTVPLWEAVLTT